MSDDTAKLVKESMDRHVERLLARDLAGVWTNEPPKAPGWYWVWQPPEQWPCRGEVYCVKVEAVGALGPLGEHLEAWVPGMDYADPVSPEHPGSETWEHALWQGPIEPPAPPRPGE